MRVLFLLICLLIPSLGAAAPHPELEGVAPRHALAIWGEPKYGPDFTHFAYTNPNAPKTGTVTQAAIGTFDSLNAHILKGVPAQGLSLIYDTLLEKSDDEIFSVYGAIVESIYLPESRAWIAFSLRPEARWHDGVPITAEDVVFTFNTLVKEGHPFYRTFYQDIASVTPLNNQIVKFTFATTENRELPLILGQLPILPKHYYETQEFGKTTLTPPLGSGPYKIDAVDPGKWIRYRRVEEYWGKDLPINKGRFNFDVMQYDYYRDATVAVEALKAGEYDIRNENIARNWAHAYDIAQVEDNRMVKEKIKHRIPTGMQGIVLNTRRPQLADPRVREALTYAFDFEWTNKALFHDSYTRTESYFSNSDYANEGLPSAKELELLAPWREDIPKRVFTTPFVAPRTDGSGSNRANLLIARDLLREAGWKVEQGTLVYAPNTPDKNPAIAPGTPFTLNFLLSSASMERVIAPFIRNLAKLGIRARMRTVDSAQYIQRLQTFDFDSIVFVYGQTNSPGNEQLHFWHSTRADMDGSRNYAGIRNPAVDALVNHIVNPPDYDTLIAATRALDRILLWNFYIIPNWHVGAFRLIYWNKFGKPATAPLYSLGFDTWWLNNNTGGAAGDD